MLIRNPSAATNADRRLMYMLLKVICSLIRNPSAVFTHFTTQQSTVAPTVAPTVDFRQVPEHLRGDYKVLVFCSLSVKVLRHAQRVNNNLQTVFYRIFFTQIYNALIVWHSKPCENEHENMYFPPQIFTCAYRSCFMRYNVCI